MSSALSLSIRAGAVGLHEPFRMGTAVRAACRDRYTLHACGLEQLRSCLGVEWFTVVNEMGSVAEETIYWIEQGSRHL